MLTCRCGKAFPRGGAFQSHVATCPAAIETSPWRKRLTAGLDVTVRAIVAWLTMAPGVVFGILLARALGLLGEAP